ncbi:MAG: GGDEF domain-containing protein [Pseudomonadota bacterium]
MGLLFWVFDAFVDVYYLGAEGTFIESLLSPPVTEIWMRSVVIVMLTGFAFYARASIEKLKKSNRELNEVKLKLEREVGVRKAAQKELQQLASLDPLTGAFNRRRLYEALDYEIERSRRYRSHLSMILCDLDHFKQVNDSFGHDEGDRILKLFTERVNDGIRRVDFLARWGGEEFAILTPNLSVGKGSRLAEKIRADIEDLDARQLRGVTISLGVTEYIEGESKTAFLKRADIALYQSKEKGRNRVTVVR